MIPKGLLVAKFAVFLLLCITAFVIFFSLSGILWGYQTTTGKPPIVFEVVIRPEHLPLEADHALFALLSSTDKNTGKQIQELLAYSVLQGKASIDLPGKGKVDVEKIVDDKMKFILPDKEYKLVVQGTSISFGNKNVGVTIRTPLPTSVLVSSEDFFPLRSISTITLPDLKKVEVILYTG